MKEELVMSVPKDFIEDALRTVMIFKQDLQPDEEIEITNWVVNEDRLELIVEKRKVTIN